MTEILIDYAPRRYFLPFHDRTQRFACIVAHRRAGKTTACIHELQKGATDSGLERPRFAYVAPLLKQAKAVAWDILKHAATPLIPHGAGINESELRVDYPNGGQVRLYGADNPDALRGIRLDGVVVDEPAQAPIDSLWREVLLPALADRRGWGVFIGTPKGRDAFFAIWRKANADRAEWLPLLLPVSRTKIIPAEELALQRASMSESQYNREWECSFDEPGVDQFIDSQIVRVAQERSSRPLGPKVLGLDVARFGDDRTVAVFRDGDVLEPQHIYVWRGLDTMQTVGRVADLIGSLKPRQTFVDGVGVGGGVVDRLRQLGFRVVDVNAGAKPMRDDRYVNSRAEMWGRMRDWLKDRGDIPDRDDLASDLVAPLYEYDHANRIKLERKEDMKKRDLPSPDIADALALTFARPVAPEISDRMTGMQVRWRTEAVTEADPLAGW